MSIEQPQSNGTITAQETARHPMTVLVVLSLLAGAIFLFDVWSDPSVDVPILYGLVILLSLFSSWPRLPFLCGIGAFVLTFVPPVIVWSGQLNSSIGVNRAITAVALLITTMLVYGYRTAEERVRKSNQLLAIKVEESTSKLRAANEALKSEIADHQRAEFSLKESQERLARTEVFSLVMVTHVGLDGRWLKVPARLCDLLGYSESELLAGTFMNVTHPDDVEADWSQCQRVIRGEIKSFELEKRYIRKDRAIVWVYLNCSGVYDADGRLLHFLTYIRNISDRKRMEDALEKSENKWRNVIETVPIGIAISTVDGQVLDINTAAWKILGYESKEEFLRLTASTHYLDPSDRQRRIERIRSGNHVFEAQYKKKDGTLFWGRCTAAIMSENDGEPVLINAYEDISEQRNYHETLQRTQDDLQTANQRLTERDRVRTKFVSVVSHELRTPMAAIKGFIDNMLNGVTGELNARQSEYLRRMQSSMERLTRLIAELLDWSSLEMGGAPILLKSFSPADLVRTIAENARAVAEAKQIHVTTDIEGSVPTILADTDKIEQVLWNLVGNAIKFTPAHGLVVIKCQRALDGGVEFTVSDTGCGILPNDIPHVFDQFSGVSSLIPSSKGAQLGLYITKSLVLLHGGRIWVESTPGEGSRFMVHLPLNQQEQ
jgi:PAS domain S-box-containing protein